MKSVEFNVSGMKCGGCVNKIEGTLMGLLDIASVEISLEQQAIIVNGEQFSNMSLKKKIEELGFSVNAMKKLQ